MERIPKGYQRVEVYIQRQGEFGWRQQSANYTIIADGSGFNTKSSAKRSASLATGVVFPPDLDYGYLAINDGEPQPNPAHPEPEPYAPEPDQVT